MGDRVSFSGTIKGLARINYHKDKTSVLEVQYNILEDMEKMIHFEDQLRDKIYPFGKIVYTHIGNGRRIFHIEPKNKMYKLEFYVKYSFDKEDIEYTITKKEIKIDNKRKD